MPRLSVIIPTYNRATLLPRVVESAWRAGTDLEVIVVDNASTDDTPQVCARLQGIRYLRLASNTGEAGGRNAGIMASRAELVAFLDDDDLRLPMSLDAQVSILEARRDVALVYGRVLIGDSQHCTPTGESYPAACPTGDVFWQLLANNFIPMPSVVAGKRHLIEAGLFDTSLRRVQDWDMWLRVAEKFSVAAVAEPVAIYRKWSLSSNQRSSNRADIYRQAALVQARALGLPRALAAPAGKRKQVRQQYLNGITDGLMREAVAALATGHGYSAGASTVLAMRLRPFRVMHPRVVRPLFATVLGHTTRK